MTFLAGRQKRRTRHERGANCSEGDPHDLPRSRLHRAGGNDSPAQGRGTSRRDHQASRLGGDHPGDGRGTRSSSCVSTVRRSGDGRGSFPRAASSQARRSSAAARRECQEETGHIPSRLERVGSYFPTPGYCDEEMTFFKATGLRIPGAGDEEAHQDEDEDIEARPFSRDDLQRMIASGDVIDLKTIAGLGMI